MNDIKEISRIEIIYIANNTKNEILTILIIAESKIKKTDINDINNS